MNQFFKIKSSIYFIRNLIFWIFLFLAGFVCGFTLTKVNAVEITTVELDFSKIENPWDLTETITFELDSYNTSHSYLHISISGTELHVYSYDNFCSLSDDTITCDYQAVYRTKYTYDSTNSAFSKGKSEMYYSATTYDINNVIYSSYEFVEPFPNVDSVYDPVYEILKDSTARNNLEYLIQEFEEKINVPFAIFYSSGFGINILYTPDGTRIYGDGDGISGGGFNYKAENGTLYKTGGFLHFDSMTQDDVDSWLEELKSDIDSENISSNGSFGSFAPDQKNMVLVYYSGYDCIEIIDNFYDGPIVWQDEEYVDLVPSVYAKIKNIKYIFDEIVDLTEENYPRKLIIHFDDNLVGGFDITYNYAVYNKVVNAPYLRLNSSISDEILMSNYLLDDICENEEDCFGQYKGTSHFEFSNLILEDGIDLIVDIPTSDVVPETRKQIRIYFEFTMPYTYEFVYENTRQTLDFTGSYGVAFFPKLKDDCNSENSSEILSSFYVKYAQADFTNTALFQRASYNSVTKSFEIVDEPHVIVPIQGSDITDYVIYKYDYNFQVTELNDVLIIRNPNYLENFIANIDYDYSLFEYQILKTEYSVIDYENPNTCENMNALLPPALNENFDENDILDVDSFFEKIGDLLNSDGSLFEIFTNFFNTLYVGNFRYILLVCLTIFIIVLITSAIRRD